MLNHISYHLERTKQLYQEILTDQSDWFHPAGRRPGEPHIEGDFNYGRMRFVNRNLNYFYYDNMLSHALKNEYTYNPHYPLMLEFCRDIGAMFNEPGPFGRMCIWHVMPGGAILPHVDNWEYHRKIRRYILCISEHEGTDAYIKIEDDIIEVRQGLLFQFNPATEMHTFANNSTDKKWYFLGFDFWDVEKLQESALNKGFTADTGIMYDDRFGGYGTKAKYMSKE